MNRELSTLHTYYYQNRIQLNIEKAVYALYHLNTRDVGRRLNISVDGKTMEFEPNQMYLGVKLDRTLTFKPHLTSVRQKVLSRCALLNRLAGRGWGASVNTLRTSSQLLHTPLLNTAPQHGEEAGIRRRLMWLKFCSTNNYWMPKTNTDAILANPCRHCPSFSPTKCRYPPIPLEVRTDGTFQ